MHQHQHQDKADIALLILDNVADGRHHFDGIPVDRWGGYLWLPVRIDLLRRGCLERVGQIGMDRCKFTITAKGRQLLAHLAGKEMATS